jgi:hypothetical protein
MCVAGLLVSLLLLWMPAKWKPLSIRRYWRDYGDLIELQTQERGFAAHGLVWGNDSILYQDNQRWRLDPTRKNWAIAQTQPVVPRIDSRRLMLDNWGPSGTTTPDGVGVEDVGGYACLPYSAMAIGFAFPLAWWGICFLMRRVNAKRI